MESLAARQDSGRKDFYASLAEDTRAQFRSKFWNGSENCLFDVVERGWERENDASIRPNQIFAVSLPHKLLEPDQSRQVLDVVERDLLTPFGLRTLSPKDPRYRGSYEGDAASRDSGLPSGNGLAMADGTLRDSLLRGSWRRCRGTPALSELAVRVAGIPDQRWHGSVTGDIRRRSSAPSRRVSGTSLESGYRDPVVSNGILGEPWYLKTRRFGS